MGRKFDGLLVSRPACFNSGVTCAGLNRVGKVPSVNERFARRVMRGMNTLRHPLIMEVGTKSMGDDLDDMLPSSFLTSSSVAGCRSSNASPVCALSNMKGSLSIPINLFAIKSFIRLILSTKNDEIAAHCFLARSGEKSATRSLVCSRSFTAFHRFLAPDVILPIRSA